MLEERGRLQLFSLWNSQAVTKSEKGLQASVQVSSTNSNWKALQATSAVEDGKEYLTFYCCVLSFVVFETGSLYVVLAVL